MAFLLWVTALLVLVHGCWCAPQQTNAGCLKWDSNETTSCCETCYPGNRLVRKCGPKPKDLCIPCRPNRYTDGPANQECRPCTQCIGVQVMLEECTPWSDTKCGCKEGLKCGDDKCSFCVDLCGKGQEPTENRSCRSCPNGTFNDQIHQKCKPWTTRCPNPGEIVLDIGSAFSDIKCGRVFSESDKAKTIGPEPAVRNRYQDETWPLLLLVLSISVTVLLAIILVTALTKRRTSSSKIKPPIIPTPTVSSDDPRTLIAIECSFHEAEQECGSSSESLVSSEASKQLIR